MCAGQCISSLKLLLSQHFLKLILRNLDRQRTALLVRKLTKHGFGSLHFLTYRSWTVTLPPNIDSLLKGRTHLCETWSYVDLHLFAGNLVLRPSMV